jgi:O-antigen/teichoic acid export membrane protein
VLFSALTIGLAAPYFLEVLVGEQYLAASRLIIYTVMGYAFGGMYYMVTNYVFYTNKTGRLALITLSTGFFNIVVTYIFIKNFGISGAAQGFMISQLLLFVCTWSLARSVYQMPWFSCFRQIS